MAGEEGLEPPLPGSKPDVLPLDDSPLFSKISPTYWKFLFGDFINLVCDVLCF